MVHLDSKRMGVKKGRMEILMLNLRLKWKEQAKRTKKECSKCKNKLKNSINHRATAGNFSYSQIRIGRVRLLNFCRWRLLKLMRMAKKCYLSSNQRNTSRSKKNFYRSKVQWTFKICTISSKGIFITMKVCLVLPIFFGCKVSLLMHLSF